MTAYTKTVGGTIHHQIGGMVLMSLGAHNLFRLRNGFRFDARILAFTLSGKRSHQVRRMTVTITLNALDYYDVRVTYHRPAGVEVVHFEREDVDCFELPKLLLALDYDGEEVLNPRYAH